MDASVDRTTVKVLMRDFVTAGLEGEGSAGRGAGATGRGDRTAGASVEIAIERVVPQHARGARPASARSSSARATAIRRAGLTPIERPIRGGTDGSRLSFMGLPTPNLFAGEHNFHSRLEWVSAQDMDKAVEVIVELCKVWEEGVRDNFQFYDAQLPKDSQTIRPL